MRTMQQKALAMIEAMIVKHGYEPVQSAGYANTGTIGIQDPTNIGNIGSVEYDFQSNSVTFRLNAWNERILSQPPRQGYYDFLIYYNKHEAFDNFFARLDETIQGL